MSEFLHEFLHPVTWEGVGRLVAVGLAALAAVVGAVGYAADRYRAAYRRLVVEEARTMVRLHKGKP